MYNININNNKKIRTDPDRHFLIDGKKAGKYNINSRPVRRCLAAPTVIF